MVCSCLGSVGDSGKIQCSPELSTSRTIWHFGREIGHKKKRVLFTFGLCMGWVSGGGEQVKSTRGRRCHPPLLGWEAGLMQCGDVPVLGHVEELVFLIWGQFGK